MALREHQFDPQGLRASRRGLIPSPASARSQSLPAATYREKGRDLRLDLDPRSQTPEKSPRDLQEP
jgi:hypothetical protein